MSEVRIRIAVGPARLEYEGSQALFDRSIAPLMDALSGALPASAVDARAASSAPDSAAQRAGSAVKPPAGPVWTPASSQHFVQFTSQVGPRAATAEQRMMAFAFYLWNYEKAESCSRAQIEAFFRTTQEEPPADFADRMERLCERKRFLEPSGKDAWRLTTKGVNYVKNRLLAAAAPM
jgi:hypothetical protein